jgi:hypothetical protein
MRSIGSGDVDVKAVSGTHVVLFGMNMPQPDTNGLLGFAIQREELFPNGETEWLRSSKAFPSQGSSTAFTQLRSNTAPFQAFQWADYTVSPGLPYRYSIFPMKGQPGALIPGSPAVVDITTEQPQGLTHSVYFNRGVVASQAYSRRYGLAKPEQVGQEALDWLARDLLPGMLDFIGRALDDRFSLHAAIYETRFQPVLKAFRNAHLREAQVRIIYDGRPNEAAGNLEEIRKARIKGLTSPREKAKIMHNKFIILSENSTPKAVWTGSTNLSKNAIYGQLNVGHVIEDSSVAQAYFDYWQQLKVDPTRAELRLWTEANNPIPPTSPANVPTVEVFSPQSGKDEFQWFISQAMSAQEALFMTFPFGIVKDFRPVFAQNDQVLRFAMLEKYINGGNAQSRAQAIAEIKAARRLPNIGMTLGGRIFLDQVDGWMKESTGLGTFVNWVHTKFMLIDPLSNNPITITGSANWSEPSMNQNDENMLVIRGNTRVADIYLTEFITIVFANLWPFVLRTPAAWAGGGLAIWMKPILGSTHITTAIKNVSSGVHISHEE